MLPLVRCGDHAPSEKKRNMNKAAAVLEVLGVLLKLQQTSTSTHRNTHLPRVPDSFLWASKAIDALPPTCAA